MRSGEARPVGRGEKEAAGGADAHLSHIIVRIRMKYIMSEILLIVRIRITAKTILLIEWMIGLRER